MEIIQKNGTTEGSFLAVEGDRIVGELTYTWSGNDHFMIDETEIINQYDGQSLGRKMIEKAVEFAREKNYTITPRSSYAQYIFDTTPAYNDVRKSENKQLLNN